MKEGDESDAEEYFGRIYSPTEDIVEGKEQQTRTAKIHKAGKLSKNSELLRECWKFLEKNSQILE